MNAKSVDSANQKVMMLVTTLTYGGAETQVVQLALALRESGQEVSVVCLVNPETHVQMLKDAGVAVHSLGMERGLPDLRAILRLRRLIREFKPDVVHSHMFHSNMLARVTRIATRMPNLVCTIHNLQELPARKEAE